MLYFDLMQIIWGKKNHALGPYKTVVTIGNFDGVHLGHQALISRVKSISLNRGLKSVVMTFEPHPTNILFPEKTLKTITSLGERGQLVQILGIDFFYVQPFSRELSQLSPEEFFRQILISNLGVQILLVGHDFSFGKNRQGTLEVLGKLCQSHGVDLEVFGPFKINDEIVSSSAIRRAVETTNVVKAEKFLGRPFSLIGIVEKGAGRGKKIGFPTANLFTTNELLPSTGVYFTQTEVHGTSFRSLTNVGINPTFNTPNKRPIQIETFILDFDEDIYGDQIKVEFLEYIRPEIKFSSVEDLISKIKEDVERAMRYQWKRK